jgi:hypothetical protein
MTYKKFRERGVFASRFMDSVGDGTGTINMGVNGATTPVEFKCTVPSDTIYLIERMIVVVQDVGGLDAGFYGNNITVANGVTLKIVRTDLSEEVLTYGRPVKTNSCWAAYCHDVHAIDFGLGDNLLSVRWTFSKDGAPLKLNAGDSLVMTINDDLTGLTAQNVKLGILAVEV